MRRWRSLSSAPPIRSRASPCEQSSCVRELLHRARWAVEPVAVHDREPLPLREVGERMTIDPQLERVEVDGVVGDRVRATGDVGVRPPVVAREEGQARPPHRHRATSLTDRRHRLVTRAWRVGRPASTGPLVSRRRLRRGHDRVVTHQVDHGVAVALGLHRADAGDVEQRGPRWSGARWRCRRAWRC